MKVHCGFMGSGELGRRDILPTEPANHRAGFEGAIADLQEVMIGLRGEVEKVQVGT